MDRLKMKDVTKVQTQKPLMMSVNRCCQRPVLFSVSHTMMALRDLRILTWSGSKGTREHPWTTTPYKCTRSKQQTHILNPVGGCGLGHRELPWRFSHWGRCSNQWKLCKLISYREEECQKKKPRAPYSKGKGKLYALSTRPEKHNS